MAEIRAFHALRFTQKAGELQDLCCPPYDIISEEERAAYLARNEHNIIRLELPREGEEPYAEAGKTLQGWLEKGILAADDEPGIYVYEEEFTAPNSGERLCFKGFLCRLRVEEWSKKVVLPHEDTLSKAKTDRFNLFCATGCNFSAIYSLYFDKERKVSPLLNAYAAGAPDTEFTMADGVTHRVWKVSDAEEVARLAALFQNRPVYIADGHHRYETSLHYRDHLRETGVNQDSEHSSNFTMMMLVDIDQPGLVVLPTHRVVRDIPDFDPARLLEGCRPYFHAESIEPSTARERLEALAAQGKKAIVFYTAGAATLLERKDDAVMAELLPQASPAYRSLDVTILHTLVLHRVLGIDKENMAGQKNLIYTRDMDEAMAAVDHDGADCAFLINATRIEEIAAVAEAGERMPQKSTYFYPKLVTGHVMNQMKNN